MIRTNDRQFAMVVLGARKPLLGEVFDIEVRPYLTRFEVECVDLRGELALVERTDDGPALSGVRSRMIAEKTPRVSESYREEAHRLSSDTLDGMMREIGELEDHNPEDDDQEDDEHTFDYYVDR